jgi:hypothetical protein
MLLAALAAAAAALAPNSSLYSDATPPTRFQGGAMVELQLTDQAGVDKACHPRFGEPPAGMKTDACAFGTHIVAPKPCAYAATDQYAHLLCHELGHVNGWPATHGD